MLAVKCVFPVRETALPAFWGEEGGEVHENKRQIGEIVRSERPRYLCPT